MFSSLASSGSMASAAIQCSSCRHRLAAARRYMLALYHLFSGRIGISEIPGGEQIMPRVGQEIDDRLIANRCHRGHCVRRHRAACLQRRYHAHDLGRHCLSTGRRAGYALVRLCRSTGVSPGSDTLVKLLEAHGPSLIIIDELVAFARQPLRRNRPPARRYFRGGDDLCAVAHRGSAPRQRLDPVGIDPPIEDRNRRRRR
ncbi:MAG: hypothetical protein R2856_28000 [Caldilineaceae bacterium]